MQCSSSDLLEHAYWECKYFTRTLYASWEFINLPFFYVGEHLQVCSNYTEATSPFYPIGKDYPSLFVNGWYLIICQQGSVNELNTPLLSREICASCILRFLGFMIHECLHMMLLFCFFPLYDVSHWLCYQFASCSGLKFLFNLYKQSKKILFGHCMLHICLSKNFWTFLRLHY